MIDSSSSSSASGTNAAAPTRPDPEALPSGLRRAQIYRQHPEDVPELIGVLPYLIHPPSKLASSASWRAFRDRTLLPSIQEEPDDPNLPRFLHQVEVILAWRATVPLEDRFWKDAD